MRYYIYLLLLLLLSCDKPQCKNSNPILDRFSPHSKEYNEELVKQLNVHQLQGLDYWIDSMVVQDGRQYLATEVQGDSLCAKLMLDITDKGDGRLEYLKSVQGRAYSGAGLAGLQYQIIPDKNGYRFIYQSLEDIED
jgi:hypothetical protein